MLIRSELSSFTAFFTQPGPPGLIFRLRIEILKIDLPVHFQSDISSRLVVLVVADPAAIA